MAEELIIRVKIDGFSGNSDKGSSDTGASIAAGAGLAGVLSGKPSGGRQGSVKDALIGDLGNYRNKEYMTKQNIADINKLGGQLSPRGIARLGTARNYIDTIGNVDPVYGETGFGEYLRDNSRMMKTMAAGLAWKTASSIMSTQQHKTGDSYYNAQLNNTVKAIGYGSALAMSGPLMPLVAIGIATNEAISLATGLANYNYDRRMEGSQIANIRALAGDASYGRRRGGM